MKVIYLTSLYIIIAFMTISCKTQLASAKVSKGVPETITFARGIDPYWQVDVSAYEIKFRTAGEGASNYPTPIPVKEGKSLIYTTQSRKNLKDTFLSLTIVTKTCYDSVLEEELPYTVTGKRDNQILVGCAK